MRSLLLAAALGVAAFAQQVPVTGVAGARFRVGDLEKARKFYTNVFGLQEKPSKGKVVAFSINRYQFVEFSLRPPGPEADPLEMVAFGAGDQPGSPLKDQEGRRVEIAAGTHDFMNSAAAVSNHLLHIGLGTRDLNQTIDFYSGHFGCKEDWRGPTPAEFRIVIMRVPGPRDDFVEFILRDEQGSKDHICFDVPDIQRTYRALVERGATLRGKPRIASNGHWVLNMADPNGIRVELMEPRVAPK